MRKIWIEWKKKYQIFMIKKWGEKESKQKEDKGMDKL